MLAHVSTLAPGTLVCHLTIAYISTYICTYTAKGEVREVKCILNVDINVDIYVIFYIVIYSYKTLKDVNVN